MKVSQSENDALSLTDFYAGVNLGLMSKATLLLLFLVSLVNLVSPELTPHCDTSHVQNAHDGCEQDVLQTSRSSESPSTSHEGTCQCVLHRTHCCGSHVLLGKAERPVIFDSQKLLLFAVSFYAIKPEPFLEGPFQPPRA